MWMPFNKIPGTYCEDCGTHIYQGWYTSRGVLCDYCFDSDEFEEDDEEPEEFNLIDQYYDSISEDGI